MAPVHAPSVDSMHGLHLDGGHFGFLRQWRPDRTVATDYFPVRRWFLILT